MTNKSEGARAMEVGGGILPAAGGEDVLHVIFILDRSGSMSGKEADVIGGFNSYVDALCANPGSEVGISYLRFDGELELVWNDVPLTEVPRMTPETYSVRGNTALLDAVGTSITAVREEPGHRYVAIVHTDGAENASREWTKEKVKELIERYEAKDNWTFAFFGEGVDAWSQAARYGYAASASMQYAAADMQDVYRAKSRVTNVMRSRSGKASKNFAAASEAALRDSSISDSEIDRMLDEDAVASKGKASPSAK